MKTRLLQEYLHRSATRRPDHVALVDDVGRLTYGEVVGKVEALAGFLSSEAGVARGDRVVIHLPNCACVAVGVFGTLEADGVFAVLNPTVKEEKLRYILNHCGARVLIGAASQAERYARIREATPSLRTVVLVGHDRAAARPDSLPPGFVPWEAALSCGAPPPAWRNIDLDLATIVYTSGSTGDPKGVMLTHANLRNTTWAISTYLGNTEHDVIFSALPMSFDYGLYQILTAFRVGARVVVETGFHYPVPVLRRMAAEGATGFPGVPTMFAMLLSLKDLRRFPLPTLRYFTNTAAVLPPDHIRRLRQAFPHVTLFSMYGLTECTRVAYLPPEELDRRPESVGKAMPNEEVWVETEDGRIAAPGEVGELVIRGSNVMRGYWADPEATARCLRPGRHPGEVVLRSGDLFKTDAEGFLYFVGRKDDIIKTRGEKVSPREVENVLHDHPSVAEAAVVGVPHPLLGHAVKAFVVLRPDAPSVGPAEIIAHCRSRLEDYMVPREVVITGELPKTATGKVRKRDLC